MSPFSVNNAVSRDRSLSLLPKIIQHNNDNDNVILLCGKRSVDHNNNNIQLSQTYGIPMNNHLYTQHYNQSHPQNNIK